MHKRAIVNTNLKAGVIDQHHPHINNSRLTLATEKILYEFYTRFDDIMTILLKKNLHEVKMSSGPQLNIRRAAMRTRAAGWTSLALTVETPRA